MTNSPVTPIDYTNLGYDALREAMLTLARESLPEWTDQSEQDMGVLLVELFAYACDITLYYQTRIANNLFPATSDEPDVLVQLLRLIGYELRPAAPATANLRLAFNAPVTAPMVIPAGTQFFVTLAVGKKLTFETTRPVLITLAQLAPSGVDNLVQTDPTALPVIVVQGQTITDDVIGIANGSPNQMYLVQPPQSVADPVIASSIQVTITEPGSTTHWQEVETLVNSGPTDRVFSVQRDAEGVVTLIFGDGVNGMIPPRGSASAPVTVKATYRAGGGPEGNVPTNTVFTPGAISGGPTIAAATNPQPASGGTGVEDIDRARSFAPRLFRAQDRAVTLRDYEDLALQVPGVGKVKAVALSNRNRVVLYIAPTGQVTDPSESLVRDVLSFFEIRRMVTTTVGVQGPGIVDIYINAAINAQPYYLKSDVQAAVEQAVADYLAFENVSFGQAIYLSKIYEVIQELPQVVSLNITRFSSSADVTLVPIETNGVIQLQPYQLPRPGYRDNPQTPPRSGIPAPIDLDIVGGVG